jgi:hypothetical protein
MNLPWGDAPALCTRQRDGTGLGRLYLSIPSTRSTTFSGV